MAEYWPVAKKFFLTCGCASSDTKKGAMQEALKKAGIHRTNIIEVSSVLDPDALELTEYDKNSIPHAAFVFAVFAHQSGAKGETIGAGVGAAWMQGKDGTRKAYVVEESGHMEESEIKKEIMISLVDIAEAEDLYLVPRPSAQTTERLLGRKEWAKKQKETGKVYEGWGSPEKEYVKYLRDNSDHYFRMAVSGRNIIPEDHGYAAAALVYVLETDQVTTKAHL